MRRNPARYRWLEARVRAEKQSLPAARNGVFNRCPDQGVSHSSSLRLGGDTHCRQLEDLAGVGE